MLRRLRDLEHWAVLSREGDDLGTIQDFYFDEERWTVRYVVVKTGRWLTGRVVLLSPMSLDHVQWDQSLVVFALTREQIQSAPDADLAMPVSRRWEAAYAGHYALPYYWTGAGVWENWATPSEARRPGAVAHGPDERLHQEPGHGPRQPEDGDLVGPGPELRVDGRHVGELQAPAELDAQEAEAHVPDLPEPESWLEHGWFGSYT